MNWKDVTIWQWQQMQNLLAKSKDYTELDIAVKSLAILTNQTESQIDSLTIKELGVQLQKIKFITETAPEPKPVDFIKLGKKRYKCIYDVKKLPYSRYLETKFFGSDVTMNLHKIGASMVVPMKLTWRGWRVAKYDASKHEEYAQDLLAAPFEQVYGSVVFFCQVFADSITNLADFLRVELRSKGMTMEEAETTLLALCESMDGFTRLPLSQTTKK
jgi:hypothetical protein